MSATQMMQMMTRKAIHPLKIVAALGAAFLLWGLVLAYVSSPALAETINVSDTGDVVENDGKCTLREAITSANNDPTSVPAVGECENGSGDDVIHIQTTGTVYLTRALPSLSSNLDMEGPGADEFTVRRDSGGDYRILTVTGDNTNEVSISGITVSNGNSRFGSGGGGFQNQGKGTLTISGCTISGNTTIGSGGGIQNLQDGNLAISGSTISGNSASAGGGIDNRSNGTMTVTDSTISGNSAASFGGGIYNRWTGTVNVSGSTISNNVVGIGNASGGQGGGLNNEIGTMTVTDSTISGNTAKAGLVDRSPGGQGAGIHSGWSVSLGLGVPTSLTVTDSTISGNTAEANAASGGIGAGIWSATPISGSLRTTIRNSTVSGNTAQAGTEFSAYGGGVYNPSGRLVVEFSTITGNTAPDGTGSGVASFGDDLTSTEVLSSIISANQGTDVDFVSGTRNSFSSDGYNLIGDGNATGAFGQRGDKPDPDPKLDPLGSYGGPTQTHRLQSDSPAMDAIPQGTNGCGTTFTEDQRGVARPRDGDANGMTGCDIGAYEEKPPELSIDDVSVTEGDSGTTEAVITVSLSRPSTQPVKVGFAPADDTATIADNDYIPFAGTINFAPGQTTRSDVVAALVKGDITHEEDETFFVNLIDPTGAEISDAQGTVTIRNDDPLPDIAAPKTTVELDPATPNGQNGWYRTAVHLTVGASDNTGGSGVAETRCVLDPATVPSSFDDLPTGCDYTGSGADVSADGQHALYAASVDTQGNEEMPLVSKQLKIDKTAPSITPDDVNDTTWRNSDLSAGFTATDGVSGLDEPGLNTDGSLSFTLMAHEQSTKDASGNVVPTTVSRTVTDNAGNSTTRNLSALIDTTNPNISASLDKNLDTSTGWYNKSTGAPTVSFQCSDALSGLAGACPASHTFGDGDNQSHSGSVSDNAGNHNSAEVNGVRVDLTSPTVKCAPAPTFVLGGAGGNVSATVTDATSGPVSESLSSAANVSTVGNKSVSLTGADNAGNSTTVSCPYTVKYRFVGPFSPIPNSNYKAGSTIPVKFALADASGTRISDAEARGLVASPCKVKVSINGGTKNCAAYNATTNTFQYNLKVPNNLSSGNYEIVVEVSAPDVSGVVNKESIGVTIRR